MAQGYFKNPITKKIVQIGGNKLKQQRSGSSGTQPLQHNMQHSSDKHESDTKAKFQLRSSSPQNKYSVLKPHTYVPPPPYSVYRQSKPYNPSQYNSYGRSGSRVLLPDYSQIMPEHARYLQREHHIAEYMEKSMFQHNNYPQHGRMQYMGHSDPRQNHRRHSGFPPRP